MITLDTWAGLKAALASDLAPAAKAILTATQQRLESFNDLPPSELCTILILEAGDRLELDPADAEYIAHEDGWWELVFILSDDGFGTVVLVEDTPEADQALLEHCRVD